MTVLSGPAEHAAGTLPPNIGTRFKSLEARPGYLATFLFRREGLSALCGRLGAYGRGGEEGGALDEPATANALAVFLVRGRTVARF